jgi:hypothetical protein
VLSLDALKVMDLDVEIIAGPIEAKVTITPPYP